tara:strand:+ start:6627 stop:7466 length:840 start_codon:yes stop_codon:yes gene_type:complete
MELVLTESGNFRDISHLYHFVELLFVGLVKIDRLGKLPQDITKINIPHWPDDSWKGKDHPHNEWILKKIFTNSEIIHEDFEDNMNTVIVDRNLCNNGNVNKTWIKYMKFFDEWKWSRMIGTPPCTQGKPVVTYINRQNDPKGRILTPGVHDKLVKYLSDRDDIKFLNLRMENFNFEEQVKFMQNTDLLIGVHGNGLTHAAFMPPHSSVCEIFIPGIQFHWDYYTLAKMMGHEYMCMFNAMPTPPYMFNSISENIVCQTDDFEPCLLRGMIDQIKEEKTI